jgi:enamine deaminase RidA (YjgF/YER057c/UK114 family)
MRTNIPSGGPFEDVVGYSRAVRVDNHVHVSGTTATNAQGQIVGLNDPAAQTRQTLTNIAAALERAGASLADVVRTRIYVIDITQWPEIARVHAEFFGQIKPAATMVEVRRLIAPEMLVEIEADAWIAA